MLSKKFLMINFLIVFLFSFLNANEQKIGNFIGGKDTIMPSWFLNSFLDLNEDINDLANENKRLILFVNQDNCPYCHKFVNENLEDKTIKETIQKNFGIVTINMFGSREITNVQGEILSEKEFAIKNKIQFTPTLIFFDENSNEILRLNGYVNTQQFNIALDYIKNKEENKIDFKEYLSQRINKEVKDKNRENNLFISSNNFVRNNNSKAMAILFESKNCQECDVIYDKYLKNEETINLLKNIDLYKVDMDSTKSIVTPQKMILKISSWANELKITHNPTIIFFDNNGKEIIRIESSFKSFHFQSIIDYVSSKAYLEEKEFQRYLTKRANAIREKGIDVNIWE